MCLSLLKGDFGGGGGTEGGRGGGIFFYVGGRGGEEGRVISVYNRCWGGRRDDVKLIAHRRTLVERDHPSSFVRRRAERVNLGFNSFLEPRPPRQVFKSIIKLTKHPINLSTPPPPLLHPPQSPHSLLINLHCPAPKDGHPPRPHPHPHPHNHLHPNSILPPHLPPHHLRPKRRLHARRSHGNCPSPPPSPPPTHCYK